MDAPEVRYTRSGEKSIAYATAKGVRGDRRL
jgi:hypothetical protein